MCCALLAASLTLLNVAVAGVATAPSTTPRIDTVNYILGTQTIGPKYHFTDRSSLVETAERIRDMGSNLLKFSMTRNYCKEEYGLPARQDIQSLTDLARNEPSVKAVLDMPFAYYHIWAYGFHAGRWQDGLSDRERDAEYQEVYALAEHLLKTYQGTGKTFYLGHWEGDWHLLGNQRPTSDPSPVAIGAMVDWLNVRQKAIDDAKRATRAEGVSLYHYTEVNLVQKARRGGKCLVNEVLPHTNVDFVSYSSYDTINPNRGNVRKQLHEALDYIESKLPPKPGIEGKRVFIGEYGFPIGMTVSAQRQDGYARDVCLAATEWGCPFVLYWQMYCNEQTRGRHRGFWLIDDRDRRQPFYFTLQGYYLQMRRYVTDYESKNARTPSDALIRIQAVEVLGRMGVDRPPGSDGDRPVP